MNKFKRAICLILAVVLIAGILPLGSFAVEMITEVGITGFSMPAVGVTAGSVPRPTPAGSDYYESGIAWYCYTDDVYLSVSDVFEAGKFYSLIVSFSPNAGFAFSKETTPSVNGGKELCDFANSSYIEDGGYYYLWTTPDLPEGGDEGFIRSVSLIGYQRPVAGQERDDVPLPTVADENAGYSVKACSWFCDSDNAEMREGDVFLESKIYSLKVLFDCEEGLGFPRILDVTVNGSADLVDFKFGGACYGTTFGIWISATPPKEGQMQPYIKNIYIHDFKKPAAGKTPADLTSDLSVPDGAAYALSGAVWYDATDPGKVVAMADGAEFDLDGRYYLELNVNANRGFYFDSATAVYIAGIPGLIDKSGCFTVAGSTYHIRTFPVSAETSVTEVNVTGYRPPVEGQTAAENVSSVKLSEGCEEYGIGWRNDTDDREMHGDDVFEAGKEYYMYFNVTAAEGYRFEEEFPVLRINGLTSLVDDEYTRYEDDILVFFTVNTVPKADNGRELITEVNVTGFKVPVAGQYFMQFKSALTVDKDAPYTIYAVYCHNNNYNFFMDGEDVFEDGQKYYFFFIFAPKEGYEFDPEAGFPLSCINGSTGLVDAEWSQYYDDGDGTVMYGFSSLDFSVSAAPAFKYGDCNGDGKVNGQDLVRLRKYLNGENVQIGPGANVNGDAQGKVNGQDLIRLRKYLNGENVVLGPN